MKLLFKQRLFSWFDSYDIYNEQGNTFFTVKGRPSWGHKLNVFDGNGVHIATLQQRVFSFMPKFEVYINNTLAGTVSREFTFFKPRYNIDYKGWQVTGDFFEWDYHITDYGGGHIATVSKELFKLTDTYVIDVSDANDALLALLLVLAIDAEKCSRD